MQYTSRPPHLPCAKRGIAWFRSLGAGTNSHRKSSLAHFSVRSQHPRSTTQRHQSLAIRFSSFSCTFWSRFFCNISRRRASSISFRIFASMASRTSSLAVGSGECCALCLSNTDDLHDECLSTPGGKGGDTGNCSRGVYQTLICDGPPVDHSAYGWDFCLLCRCWSKTPSRMAAEAATEYSTITPNIPKSNLHRGGPWTDASKVLQTESKYHKFTLRRTGSG